MMLTHFYKKSILLALVVLYCYSLFAQPKNSEPDTIILRQLLNKAGSFIKKAQQDSAIFYFNTALKKATAGNHKKIEADAYNNLAEIMQTNGKIKEAISYDSLLIPVALRLKDTTLIINSKNRTGLNLIEQGKTSEAADNFLSILNLKLEKEQSLKTAEVYSNMASLYMAIGKNDQAMEWFFKALRLYEKFNNNAGLGETYSNVASIYYLMGRTDDAIAFQKKSISFREKLDNVQSLVIPHINIGQLYILKDSFALARQYLSQAVTYAEKINNTRLMASAYSGMSTYHIKMKEFDLSLQWQSKSIALFEAAGNKPMLSRLYVSAGNLANATNDSAGAFSFYKRALELSSQLGNKENIANAYEKMSNFFLSHKDYLSAYQYYKNFTSYRDTIAMASNLSNIEKVKIQYETEKKDKEISGLAAGQRIKQLQIEKQNALLAGNLLIAKQKEKEIDILSQAKELQELRIKQQDEQLEKQMLLAKNNEQQLQLSEKEKQLQERKLKNSETTRNFILAGIGLLAILAYFLFNRYQLKRKIQEQEALLTVRNNIAKDLHDEIGSTLTSIKILSEVSGKNLHKDQVKTSSFLQKITEQSSAAQQGISDIVWAVKPENDKLGNMIIRMREYAAQTLESKNIKTIINIDEEVLNKTLDMSQRRDFLLIFREAVNNIAKYAAATEVTIKLDKKNADLQLQIIDNGKGFDTTKPTSSSGLKNMHARAIALKGSLHIQSESEKGTAITLLIPSTT